MAAPLPKLTGIDGNANVIDVRHRRWHRHRHHRHHHHRHRRGWGPGAVIGGIVAGALIAGAIRESRASDSDMERCADTYRSFDWRTGTYTTYDGRTVVCPYLR